MGPVAVPLAHPTFEPTGSKSKLRHVANGVAIALQVLMQFHFSPGCTPHSFDERRYALRRLGAAVTSFDWTSRRVGVPPIAKVHELVWLLVVRLDMS
eukprot:CAMPEP_0119090966 /NCGR_PEP_ID=MMETSP1178-20130426/154709_1 /TAXON_ID=33656 /ORGANISM="unid sp, Strain CCMP2000" /LENGTH=96 /DNA_ID=CAMNT_0007074427 /DNA_START=45 /DNA_END=331 /DNA_ORIENTATION=+